MTLEFANGATSGVLRLRANDGGWTPVHMTINRIELEPGTFAALMALRLPTEAELEVVEFADDDETEATPRRSPKRQEAQERQAQEGQGRLARPVDRPCPCGGASLPDLDRDDDVEAVDCAVGEATLIAFAIAAAWPHAASTPSARRAAAANAARSAAACAR